MTEEAKMWLGLAVFMLLPVAIMGVAWMTDWLDRRANSVTDRATDRP